MSPQMIGYLFESAGQTLFMVGCACGVAVLVGLPLGVVLLLTRHGHLLSLPAVHRGIGVIVNVLRSIPFIILMVAMTPLTQWVVGTTIGTVAATVPLSLAAIPFFARLVESALTDVPVGLIEAAQSMGASTYQIVRHVLIAEALPSIVRATVLTLITLVGYSAMAGAVGGGGLGDLAIRYGYQRFELGVMVVTVAVLIVLVQILQWVGDGLVRRLSHND